MIPFDDTHHWLSVRVRLICCAVFIVGSLLPAYVPSSALAVEETAVAQQQFLLVEEGFLMKSSSLTRYGARRAYSRGRLHVVKEGESLEGLAKRYDIAADTIRWANDLKGVSTIHPGDELTILPVDGVLHTVSRGQTLSRIAQLYDISLQEIRDQNELKSEFILAGQQLIIPGARPIVSHQIAVATTDAPDDIAKPTPPAPSTPKPDTQTPTPAAEKPDTKEPVVVRTTSIAPEDITDGVLQKPCSKRCFITQYFHAGHYALDMQEKGGGNVYASEAGTITRADYGWNGGYGNVIEIDHGNSLVTLYAHNKKLYVKKGDRVARGTKVADMGNTGLVYGPTGIHVHYEVRLKGVKKNPIVYIQ